MTIGGPNDDQARHWNAESGATWVAYQALLDRLFSGVKAELLRRCSIAPGERVLDVSCGSGDITLAVAEATGAGGMALGVDISETLLALARARASGRTNIAFICGDAQTYPFEAGHHDVLTSRFGVMFFADPGAALSNLAAALRPGGRLVFAAWSAMNDNPWSVLPRAAVVERLGALPETPPSKAGQFAFADRSYVVGLLRDAGFSDASGDLEEIELIVDGTAEDAAGLAVSIGPASRALAEHAATADDRSSVLVATARALERYATGDKVRVPARLNFFSGTKAP